VSPDPVELARELIRYDTTNPPGDEEACVAHIERLLGEAGIESERHEKAPGRPNLVARSGGDGTPLVLYGHVDVVTTTGQAWTKPPFGGDLDEDGYVWGRGALDMKGGVAQLVSAFIRAHEDGLRTPLVLVVLSDEENGGDLGARFLTEERPEAFGGARHAIGEWGAATQVVAGRRFYPIQVGEKQICWLRGFVRGRGGHSALGVRGSAMAKLGRVLQILDRKPLPVHVTPIVRQWIERTADALPRGHALVLRRLLDPRTTDLALRALGPHGRIFGRVLRNTAAATIVRGGDKINVVPSEIELQVDGRLLPGLTPDDLIVELAQLVGNAVEWEVVRHDPGPTETDWTFFAPLAEILRELDRDAVVVPMLQPGVTDGRFLSRAGIQTYGFLPLRLPDDFDPLPLVHAADERVPAEALRFGAEAIYLAIERYGG
jgi:acetylornithine deacetylase/succinyl-diaminopimelate desuccinylase-like protein